MQGHIEILIGARALPSIDTIFGSLPKKAEHARAGVDRALNRAGRGAFKGFESDSAKASAKMVSDQTRAVLAVARVRQNAERQAERERIASERRVVAEQNRLGREQQRQQEYYRNAALQATRTRIREEERAARIVAREEQRAARQRVALQRAEQRAFEQSFGYRTAYHGVIRYLPGAMHRGARIGHDILRGAGVDFNLGESVRRNVDWQKEARLMLNQAGTIGEQLTKEELYGAIRGTADQFGYNRESIAQSLNEFARITGSPRTAMEMSTQVALRAAGSNASIEDMMAMAGDIYSHLGDHVKDKAASTLAVIDAALLQGEKGGVTIGMLARGFAKIGGSASQFEGGDVQNMKSLGALTQLARKYGGVTSAASALTAIERFTNQLSTGARAKAFRSFGVDIMSQTEHGKFRDPLEILQDAVIAAKGDPQELSKMLQSSIAVKAARPLMNAYNAALDRGEDPRAAMKKTLNAFLDVAAIQKNLQRNVAERESDTFVKAQKFQNQLDSLTEQMMAQTLPALEKLAPAALDATKAFGNLVSWSAQHPLEAGGAMLGVSLARAAIESVVRAQIEAGIAAMFRARQAGALPGTGGFFPTVGGGVPPGRFAGVAGVAGGVLGGFAGISTAHALGLNNNSAGGVLASIAAAGAGGFATGGVVGGLAGLTFGAAKTTSDIITTSIGGYEGFWEGLKSFVSGDGFFKGVDELENRRARAAAARDAASPSAPAAQVAQPIEAKIDHTALSSSIASALQGHPLRIEGKVEVANMPSPGSALEPPRVSDKGRSGSW